MNVATQEVKPESSPSASAPCFPPDATIGLLGSGQLGRMFTQAAQRLGYRVHVFSSEADSPTGQIANVESVASYSNREAVEDFARSVDVVTLEFENVPAQAVEWATEIAPVRPSANVLHSVQHRVREKEFLAKAGVASTPFRAVNSLDQLRLAVDEIGLSAVLKTAEDGYDGKGQQRITSTDEIDQAWNRLGTNQAILESFVDFQWELSVLAVRGVDGSLATYGPIANTHRNHILDISVLPLPELMDVAPRAIEMAQTIAQELDVVGIICVEFFLTNSGELLVNEIAPRPHNSGHLTLDAHATSQFEQQVRAVCGMPLGSTAQLRPAAMANLLGDLWQSGEPNWAAALAIPDVSLHLYGKRDARPGRKMGHLTALADTPAEAERLVCAARDAITE